MTAFTVYRSADIIEVPVSTRSPSGNVLTAVSPNTAFLASDNTVKCIDLSYTTSTGSDIGSDADERCGVPFDFESGVGVRNPYADMRLADVSGHVHAKNQIVSIASYVGDDVERPHRDNRGAIASVDGYGNVVLNNWSRENSESPVESNVTHIDAPVDCIRKEYGWSGVEYNPRSSSELTTALQHQRSINIYQDDKLTRSLYAELPIHALTYIDLDASRDPLICVTERQQISVWDARVSERGGCIRRMMPGSGVLHTITSNKKGICAAGIDRVAFFIDPRRWRASGSWRGGLKFDINKVYLSGSLDNTAFAFGRIDGEFATGSWEAKGNKTSSSRLTKKNFLADSRYVGVGRIPGEDAFISIVSSKHLYTLDHCDAYATRALPKSTHSPPPVDGPLDHVGKKKKLNDEKSD